MKLFQIILLLSVAALTGCTDFFNQVVDIEIPEHEPSLAVSAHFRAQDTALIVFVSRSAGILDSVILDSVSIQGAAVAVLRDGSLWQTVPNVGPGHFYLAMGEPIGDQPHTYTLQVSAPGFESVEAVQVMPTSVSILDAVYTVQGGVNPDGEKVNTLSVEFQDPAGEDNYYYVDAYYYIPDSIGDFGGNIYIQTEDALVEPYEQGLIFKDGPIDGKKYALKTWFWDNVHEIPGAKLVVRLHSISRDRYLFLRTLDLYTNAQGNPFAEPVVVHDNIEKGVGIFGVSSVARWEIGF
ncbi:MAG: DUF4249 domain-containing protein [Saprospirales bacterium]|nr:DUF4249 domain-containing protein [Saprospirales bacterium]